MGYSSAPRASSVATVAPMTPGPSVSWKADAMIIVPAGSQVVRADAEIRSRALFACSAKGTGGVVHRATGPRQILD